MVTLRYDVRLKIAHPTLPEVVTIPVELTLPGDDWTEVGRAAYVEHEIRRQALLWVRQRYGANVTAEVLEVRGPGAKSAGSASVAGVTNHDWHCTKG